jgi:hypothetical protein
MENLFSLLLVVVVLFLSLVSFFTWRRILNVGIMISYWWLGWLGVCWFGYSYVYSPSIETAIYIVIFAVISVVGSVIGYSSVRRLSIDDFGRSTYYIFKKIHKYLYPFVLLYIFFLLFNAVKIYYSGDISSIRSVVASSFESGSHPIFYSKIDFFMFRFFVSPYIISFTFVGVVSYTVSENYDLIIKSVVLTLATSFVMFNRLYLYILIVSLVASFIMYYNNINKKIIKGGLKYVVLVFLIILSISFLRMGKFSMYKIFNTYIVGYHTINFELLDREVRNSNSLLHDQKTWGIGLFGGAERLASTYISKMYKYHEHIVWSNRSSHWEFKPVGKHDDGSIAYSNAHYNIVYTFLRDGGVVVLVIYSFLLSLLFGITYKTSKYGSSLLVFLSLFLFVNVYILSLLKSRVESHEFWLPIIILSISSLIANKK